MSESKDDGNGCAILLAIACIGFVFLAQVGWDWLIAATFLVALILVGS